MWSRMLKGSVIAGLLCLAVIGVTACGGDDDGGSGDDELSLEEYFEQLEAASDKFTEESEASQEELEASEEVEAIKDSFAKLPQIVEDFMNDIDELNPPEEAQDAHDEAVEAGRAFADQVDDVLNELEDVDTIEELSDLEFGDAFNDADERFSAACNDLQQLADENNIEVDLDCGDGDE